MTVYISRDDSAALTHYGVKGMKWGVRHDKERQSAGSKPKRPDASRRKGLFRDSATKIARTKYKIDKANWKMSRYGNRDSMSRYVNDFRRGRKSHLEKTLANRQAKATYKANPTKANKKALNKTREARAANIATTALLSATQAGGLTTKGAYQRYRKNGNSVFNSVLKSAGTYTVRSLAANSYVAIGAAATSAIGRRVNPTRLHNNPHSQNRAKC